MYMNMVIFLCEFRTYAYIQMKYLESLDKRRETHFKGLFLQIFTALKKIVLRQTYYTILFDSACLNIP